MTATTAETLQELKRFLLDRLADRERHIRERWTPSDGFEALQLIQSQRSMIYAWPDPFGQWTAEQAEAATAMKLLMLRRMSEEYSTHPDYQREWAAPVIPRALPLGG